MLNQHILFEEPERMDSSDFSAIPVEFLNWWDIYDRLGGSLRQRDPALTSGGLRRMYLLIYR
jgi:hypothetical protein